MNFKKCSNLVSYPILVVKECGRLFRINNPRRITVKEVLVDDCLITGNRERCDFLFEFTTSAQTVIYLELKGSDIGKAVSQIVKTIGYCDKRHRDWRKRAHIVASRVPKAGPKVQNLQFELAKAHQAILSVGTVSVSISLAKAPYV